MACFVAGVPVWSRGLLPCSVLWFVVVSCSPVLCPVELCFRVVLCCAALLSVLLCWWCLFVLMSFTYLWRTRKNGFIVLKNNENYTQPTTRASSKTSKIMSTYMFPAVRDGLQVLLATLLPCVLCKGLTVFPPGPVA